MKERFFKLKQKKAWRVTLQSIVYPGFCGLEERREKNIPNIVSLSEISCVFCGFIIFTRTFDLFYVVFKTMFYAR
jgi:hypothetical protein